MRLEASVVTLVEFVVLVVSKLLRRCRRTELWVAHVRDKYVSMSRYVHPCAVVFDHACARLYMVLNSQSYQTIHE